MRNAKAGVAIGIIAIAIAIIGIAVTGAGLLIEIDFHENDTLVASQQGINLIDGANIAITAVENDTENRVDYTIAATGAAGGWDELARFTTTGGESGVEFSSIPASDFLWILAQGVGANVSAAIRVYFNEDSDTNYSSNQGSFHSYVGSSNNDESGCRIFHGSSVVGTGSSSAFNIVIQNLDGIGKAYQGGAVGVSSTGTSAIGCRWTGTAQITNIELILEDSRTFNANATFVLLGR